MGMDVLQAAQIRFGHFKKHEQLKTQCNFERARFVRNLAVGVAVGTFMGVGSALGTAAYVYENSPKPQRAIANATVQQAIYMDSNSR
jgi:hypothetical protein